MQLYLSQTLAAIHGDELRRHAETRRNAGGASSVHRNLVVLPKKRPHALLEMVRLALLSLS